MPLRVFLVDDESHVRDELKYLLAGHGQVEVVGEADNAFDAVREIQHLRPDAAFLDIHLGDVDGLTLARKLRDTLPDMDIVFVTALDGHAVEGFELDAADYVLKPLSEERLARTVERLLSGRAVEPAATPNTVGADKIAVKHNQVWKLVNLSDIYYFQTQDHSTTAHTRTDTYQLNYTLRELEMQLDAERFMRTHKSFIVNINYIDAIIPWFNYTYKITLRDKGTELPVSRSYIKNFKSMLNLT